MTMQADNITRRRAPAPPFTPTPHASGSPIRQRHMRASNQDLVRVIWVTVVERREETFDADVAVLLQARDAAGLERLYDRYGVLAFTVATRILGDSQMAEEAVQDAFHSIWRNAASFNPGRGTIKAWLLQILRNRCFDLLRSRGARPQIAPEAELERFAGVDDVESEAARTATGREVRAALDELPGPQREVLDLAYYAGLSQSEIADRLDLPLGTVKGRVRAAMQRLRATLSPSDVEL